MKRILRLLAARSGGWDTGDAQPGADTRSTSDYLGGQMDLTARGSLDDDPLALVPAASPRLWRAGTLDTYDGRTWTATDDPAGPPELTAERAGVLALRYPAAPVGAGGGAATEREDVVRPLRRGVTQVLAPGRLVTVGASTFSAGGSAVVSAGDRVTVVGTAPKSYFVRSQPLPASADPVTAPALGAVPKPPAAGDDLADERYLALPTELPDRVRELAQRLAGSASSRLLVVRAIERELAARVRYDLDSPVPSPGVDAVDDVLFVSHEGFCEQFASAEVVMLRAVGIPARMAVGFSASAPSDSGERPLRRSDAHAWVEVWFPSVGWVNSDPTPPGDASTSWFERASTWLGRALRQAGTHWPLVLSVVAATVLVGTGVVLVVVRLRRPEPPAPTVDPDLAAAFVRLQADLEAVGAGRDPTETVGMLARRLPADLRQPLLVLERALYAPTPPTRSATG